jgi:hypothetical protein
MGCNYSEEFSKKTPENSVTNRFEFEKLKEESSDFSQQLSFQLRKASKLEQPEDMLDDLAFVNKNDSDGGFDSLLSQCVDEKSGCLESQSCLFLSPSGND